MNIVSKRVFLIVGCLAIIATVVITAAAVADSDKNMGGSSDDSGFSFLIQGEYAEGGIEVKHHWLSGREEGYDNSRSEDHSKTVELDFSRSRFVVKDVDDNGRRNLADFAVGDKVFAVVTTDEAKEFTSSSSDDFDDSKQLRALWLINRSQFPERPQPVRPIDKK